MSKVYNVLTGILSGIMSVILPWKARGLENIPDGAVVLCGNHTSMLDPLYLICATRKLCQLRIVAKAELFKIPVLGYALKKIGVIGIKRGMADINAVKECLRVLRNGEKLLIFPEGTRVKKHQRVKPHTGAVVISTRAGAPLLPVFIPRKKGLFRKPEIIFGQAYTPELSGRKATPEESQMITTDLMTRIFALGN